MDKGKKIIACLIHAIIILCCSHVSEATTYPYPGQCGAKILYTTHPTATSTQTKDVTINATTGDFVFSATKTTSAKPGKTGAVWYKSNDNCTEANPAACWTVASSFTAVAYLDNYPPGIEVGSTTTVNPQLYSHVAQYLTCPNNACAAKTGQPIYNDSLNYPVLTKLPYHAAYYTTVGVCIDSCVAKPNGPVILDQYASDNSGYTVGPFAFTGEPCTETTAQPPPQPTPDEVCANTRNACEAQCDGKAYQHDCEAGSCECFGAPSYSTDPPVEPTEPTPDPATPSAPAQQTAVADPGGDAQSSAQIANQAKQIQQQNDQNTQLGSLNNKLSAMISNQAKALGQGDKIIDYNRQQLGILKDIRDKLNEDSTGSNPGVPGSVNYDSSIGNEKDWGEHDNFSQVGHDRALREQSLQSASPGMPLSFSLHASGGPALSGQMFGRTVEIRFDRPWMETGYSLMKVLFVGIGYLQVFLMVNRTILNDR